MQICSMKICLQRTISLLLYLPVSLLFYVVIWIEIKNKKWYMLLWEFAMEDDTQIIDDGLSITHGNDNVQKADNKKVWV